MSTTVTVIVGPMRSGTSAVSEVVHFLGSPCGISIPAPVPPTWRSDWEDYELSTSLLALLPFAPIKPKNSQRIAAQDYLAMYVKRRMRWHDILSGIRDAHLHGWSMKSPLLALVFDQVRAAILDEPELRLRVLKVTRNPDGIEASFLRTLAEIDGAAATQVHILEALEKIEADYVVNYDQLVADPARIVPRIANAIGVEDARAISRAALRVMRPTSMVGV